MYCIMTEGSGKSQLKYVLTTGTVTPDRQGFMFFITCDVHEPVVYVVQYDLLHVFVGLFLECASS